MALAEKTAKTSLPSAGRRGADANYPPTLRSNLHRQCTLLAKDTNAVVGTEVAC